MLLLPAAIDAMFSGNARSILPTSQDASSAWGSVLSIAPTGQPAAQIAIETVLCNIAAPIEKVIFCCFSDSDTEIYRTIFSYMEK